MINTKRAVVLLLSLFLLAGGMVQAAPEQEKETVKIHMFYGKTCPHCAQEREFLERLKEKYDWLEVKEYEISVHPENREKLLDFYEQYEVSKNEWGMVPILFTPHEYFLGFNQSIGQEIENCLKECQRQEGADLQREIDVPLIGTISLTGLPPLLLAVVMGTLDGFNACAMTALGFLLTVLISTGTRKRVFWIGGTFILVSGLVYFIFAAASLNLFMVLEQLKFITMVAGIVVIVFALYLLRDYFHGVVCKLCETDPEKQSLFVKWEQKLFKKLQKISQSNQSLPVMLLGVAIVAAGINLVELVCSFGFPLAFTKILTSLNLSTLSYYSYLFVYILFYMIDDFIIFSIAVTTLEVSQVSEKYLKAIKLISALVLLGLGVVMIVKPELLALT